MSGKGVDTRLRELLEPLADANGVEFVHAEMAGPKGSPIVRVYLDREGGIDLDSIAQANTWISEALDAEPPVGGSYVLEVSSPGLDRPLPRLQDVERFAGSRAVVKTARPLDGRRSFTGVIEEVDGDGVVIDCDGDRFEIPFADVVKAHVRTDVSFDDE
jgi:ribosome maturation factor RimP